MFISGHRHYYFNIHSSLTTRVVFLENSVVTETMVLESLTLWEKWAWFPVDPLHYTLKEQYDPKSYLEWQMLG